MPCFSSIHNASVRYACSVPDSYVHTMSKWLHTHNALMYIATTAAECSDFRNLHQITHIPNTEVY